MLSPEETGSRTSSERKKTFSVIADEYGYSGREIAAFVEKDPSVISRYLKKKAIRLSRR